MASCLLRKSEEAAFARCIGDLLGTTPNIPPNVVQDHVHRLNHPVVLHLVEVVRSATCASANLAEHSDFGHLKPWALSKLITVKNSIVQV